VKAPAVRPLERESLKRSDILQALRDAYPNPRPRMIQAAIWSIEERAKDEEAERDILPALRRCIEVMDHHAAPIEWQRAAIEQARAAIARMEGKVSL
jgi:hypothetical protein